MTQEEINEILEKHTKWLAGEKGGAKANLCEANLSFANLEGANLASTNLEYACLYRTIGNNREIKTLQLGKYLVVILTGVMIHIGGEEHSIKEWENFTDAEIEAMDEGILEWWKEWKETIMKVAKGAKNG